MHTWKQRVRKCEEGKVWQTLKNPQSLQLILWKQRLFVTKRILCSPWFYRVLKWWLHPILSLKKGGCLLYPMFANTVLGSETSSSVFLLLASPLPSTQWLCVALAIRFAKPVPDSGRRKVTRLAAFRVGKAPCLSSARLPLRAAEYLNEDIYYNTDTED